MNATRWWWIRHAPVCSGGRIYGQRDVPADCTDTEAFTALARRLPEDALWVTSHLQRTRQTAEAILEQGRGRQGTPARLLIEPGIAEQNFGAWQGLTHDELARRRGGAWHRFWLAPAHEAPPGGESFVEVMARVAEAIRRLSAEHAGREIVAVAHGGSIRAALALALGLEPEKALAIAIENCSLTRLDLFSGAAGSHLPEVEGVWRVAQVNLSPADLAARPTSVGPAPGPA